VTREETRTGFGDVDDAVVIVPDTDRRGIRHCGSCRRDTGEGVVEDSEPCVVLRDLDAPELLPVPEAENDDRVGIPPWKCKWRCTGGWRANKSLIIVLSASLSRTPFGRFCFLTVDDVVCGCLESSGRGNGTEQGYSREGTECLAAAAQAYW